MISGAATRGASLAVGTLTVFAWSLSPPLPFPLSFTSGRNTALCELNSSFAVVVVADSDANCASAFRVEASGENTDEDSAIFVAKDADVAVLRSRSSKPGVSANARARNVGVSSS